MRRLLAIFTLIAFISGVACSGITAAFADNHQVSIEAQQTHDKDHLSEKSGSADNPDRDCIEECTPRFMVSPKHEENEFTQPSSSFYTVSYHNFLTTLNPIENTLILGSELRDFTQIPLSQAVYAETARIRI